MKLRARRSQAISDDSLAELQISQLVKEEEQRANLKGGVAHDQQDDSILLFDTTELNPVVEEQPGTPQPNREEGGVDQQVADQEPSTEESTQHEANDPKMTATHDELVNKTTSRKVSRQKKGERCEKQQHSDLHSWCMSWPQTVCSLPEVLCVYDLATSTMCWRQQGGCRCMWDMDVS